MALDSQNKPTTGFEDSPHMIPGDVESAQQIQASTTEPMSTNGKATAAVLVLFLLAMGSWMYSNQDQIKESLGFARTAPPSCATHEGDPMLPEDFAVNLEAIPGCPLHATDANCCEQGQNFALKAALLQGVMQDDVIPAEEVNEMPEIAMKSQVNSTSKLSPESDAHASADPVPPAK